MKQVLRDALDLACYAGKHYRGAEDLKDPGSQDELRRVGDRLMKDAWERLATLPNEVGDAARAELARMTGK